MKYIQVLSALTFLPGMFTSPGFASKLSATEAFGRAPLTFEANQGQMDQNIRFVSRAQGLSVALKPTEAVLGLSGPTAIHMRLIGGNPAARLEGFELQPKRTNYLIGEDRRKWHTGIANYGRVRYSGVWPGIDLIFYGNRQRLEYDLIVAPGADPGSIQMAFDGAQGLRIDPHGNLMLQTAAGEFCQVKPKIYQKLDGRTTEIDGRYVLGAGHRVSFRLGAYDKRFAVVVDPVFMRYSTFVGGKNSPVDFVSIESIAVDGANNAYITGRAQNFPGLAASTQGVFVAKLNPSGSGLLYETYIGGTALGGNGNNITATQITLDPSGNAYVVGFTTGPTSVAWTTRIPSSLPDGNHAFAVKLNSTGSTLLYAVLIGGSNTDQAFRVALDGALEAYVYGSTNSPDFPGTSGHFQPARAGLNDIFIAKLNAAGTALVASTYFGGSLNETTGGIAVDSSGNVYISGTTASNTDFPSTTGPLGGPAAVSGDSANFAAKFSGDLNSRVYSALISWGASSANGLAIDPSGNAYVTGSTSHPLYPSQNGFAPVMNPPHFTAYLTKLNSTGSAVLYSTGLGGRQDPLGADATNVGLSVAVDAAGNAYVTGYTNSTTFPVTPTAVQSSFAGPANSNTQNLDAFYTKLNTNLSGAFSLLYSTYLGSRGLDKGLSIALDNSQSVYVAGATGDVGLVTGSSGPQTDNFPVTANAYQTAGPDPNTVGGFVTRFAAPDKIAIFRDGSWSLDRDNNGQWEPAPGDGSFYFGQKNDIPLRGDWNGDGRVKVGIFRNGVWSLDSNGDGQFTPGVDAGFYFGQAGDIPVVGDWNGDGRAKVGIFRPSSGLWALDFNGNNQYDPGVDPQFYFGSPNDIPVVGDWTGDGRTKVGIFRQNSGIWALDTNGNFQYDPGVDPAFYFGSPNDIPVVGDWTGNGRTKVGIFRNGLWALDTNGDNQFEFGIDAQFYFGQGSDIPLVGDWSGDGRSKVGIFRSGLWTLDSDGTNFFETATDRAFYYGLPTDQPVTGPW